MIITDDIKNSWEVDSLLDFIKQFKIEEWALKKFDIDNVDDIYDVSGLLSDEEYITEWLEQSERKFRIIFIENYKREYWLINEL